MPLCEFIICSISTDLFFLVNFSDLETYQFLPGKSLYRLFSMASEHRKCSYFFTQHNFIAIISDAL